MTQVSRTPARPFLARFSTPESWSSLYAGSPEPRAMRWQRRSKTIPMMLGATLAGLLALPFAVPLLAVADVARGRLRLPSVRVYLFLVHYGVNDSVEILLAPWYWILAGFGTRLLSRGSIARHDRVQQWSVRTLAASAERLLGLRVDVDGDVADLAPGPVIVLCNHVSVFDSSLPMLLGNRAGLAVRGVIMAELLADPGFDLFYRRSGSVFILREQGAESQAAISEMGTEMDTRTAVGIFPEGRLFTPELRDRFLAKVATTDPARAERLAALHHVLPPRPGGVGVLLDALPTADVVMLTHVGLESGVSFASLARHAPLRRPVTVRVERIDRSVIPAEPEARTAWLDDLWLDADDWVDRRTTVAS